MGEVVSLGYCIRFNGEHYQVDDLVRVTDTAGVQTVGRIDKLNANLIILDCSEEFNAKTVTVPILKAVEISSDLTIVPIVEEPVTP